MGWGERKLHVDMLHGIVVTRGSGCRLMHGVTASFTMPCGKRECFMRAVGLLMGCSSCLALQTMVLSQAQGELLQLFWWHLNVLNG